MTQLLNGSAVTSAPDGSLDDLFAHTLEVHAEAMKADELSSQLRNERNRLITELLDRGAKGSRVRMLAGGANPSQTRSQMLRQKSLRKDEVQNT